MRMERPSEKPQATAGEKRKIGDLAEKHDDETKYPDTTRVLVIMVGMYLAGPLVGLASEALAPNAGILN